MAAGAGVLTSLTGAFFFLAWSSFLASRVESELELVLEARVRLDFLADAAAAAGAGVEVAGAGSGASSELSESELLEPLAEDDDDELPLLLLDVSSEELA